MREFWILPHHSQSGDMKVLCGNSEKSLVEVLNVSCLPRALVLGAPEDVLRSNPSDEFVYAEFARCSNGTSIFSQSVRAGKDKGGRTILLTHVQIFEKDEHPVPTFPCDSEKVKRQLSGRLDPELLKGIVATLGTGGTSREQIQDMLAAINCGRTARTFASAASPASANPHDWYPERKKKRWVLAFLTVALFILILFIARSCD